jgi:hypothetical protein
MSNYETAKMSIRYRPEIAEKFEKVSAFPDRYIKQFLEILDQNPSISANDIFEIVDVDYQNWLNPYSEKAKNIALNKMRSIGPKAEAEFINVLTKIPDVDLQHVIDVITERYVREEKTQRPVPNVNDIYPNNKVGVVYGQFSLEHFKKKYGLDAHGLMELHQIVSEKISNAYVYCWSGKKFKSLLDALIAADSNNGKEGDRLNSSVRKPNPHDDADKLDRKLEALMYLADEVDKTEVQNSDSPNTTGIAKYLVP